MQKVFTVIGNLPVNSGYFKSCNMSVVRPLLFARVRFLHLFKLFVQALKKLRIVDFISCRSSNQTIYPHIQANRFINLGQVLNSIVVYQQGDKLAPSSIQLNRYSRWFAFFWQLPTHGIGNASLHLASKTSLSFHRKAERVNESTTRLKTVAICFFQVSYFTTYYVKISEASRSF